MGGQDATEAFEDVGHSDEAREILTGLAIGSLKRTVRPQVLAEPPRRCERSNALTWKICSLDPFTRPSNPYIITLPLIARPDANIESHL